jgi:hypothetical protein
MRNHERQAAQELGQVGHKERSGPLRPRLDPSELVRRLHEGRKRAREFWIARELEVRRAVQELEQGNAKSEPSTISG